MLAKIDLQIAKQDSSGVDPKHATTTFMKPLMEGEDVAPYMIDSPPQAKEKLTPFHMKTGTITQYAEAFSILHRVPSNQHAHLDSKKQFSPAPHLSMD